MTNRRHHRLFPLASIAGLLMLAGAGSPAVAADAIRVGRTPDASIFHLPTYIAADKGIFREEGLDATFVTRDDTRELTAAGIGRAIDFVPDAGGARVSIKGAPVRYIVGQALVSPWVIVANPDTVKSVEDLRSKTLALGAPGMPDYEETVSILQRFFGMAEARHYKTAGIPAETGRLAALIDGRVQGALISWRQVPRAGIEGMDIVLKTRHYLPRLEGAYWVTATYLEERPDTVRRFIRAIARATLYLATDQMGSIEVIQKRFGLESPAEANVLWNAVHREFDPGISSDLLRQSFSDSMVQLRRKGLWPNDKPMPAVEQFIASDIMKTALREIGY
jgi:ABC-type nitrate/sulfonate/bicarbonate transport system substrate-binding protein